MLMHKTPPKWDRSDVIALEALAPLRGGYVAWTSWSMRPAALATIVNEIVLKQRRQVLELGSGTSTLFLARALSGVGGNLISVEHDAEWASYIEQCIRAESLEHVARVELIQLAPFAPEEPAPEATDWPDPEMWYDMDALRAVCPSTIDMLIVDGPPAGRLENVKVRHPAVPVLKHALADDFTIFLDDVDRGAEQETVRLWEEELNLEMSIIERIALAIGRSQSGIIPSM
jgi:hypothetical protein